MKEKSVFSFLSGFIKDSIECWSLYFKLKFYKVDMFKQYLKKQNLWGRFVLKIESSIMFIIFVVTVLLKRFKETAVFKWFITTQLFKMLRHYWLQLKRSVSNNKLKVLKFSNKCAKNIIDAREDYIDRIEDSSKLEKILKINDSNRQYKIDYTPADIKDCDNFVSDEGLSIYYIVYNNARAKAYNSKRKIEADKTVMFSLSGLESITQKYGKNAIVEIVGVDKNENTHNIFHYERHIEGFYLDFLANIQCA